LVLDIVLEPAMRNTIISLMLDLIHDPGDTLVLDMIHADTNQCLSHVSHPLMSSLFA
jgi:hypothetical protein